MCLQDLGYLKTSVGGRFEEFEKLSKKESPSTESPESSPESPYANFLKRVFGTARSSQEQPGAEAMLFKTKTPSATSPAGLTGLWPIF